MCACVAILFVSTIIVLLLWKIRGFFVVVVIAFRFDIMPMVFLCVLFLFMTR